MCEDNVKDNFDHETLLKNWKLPEVVINRFQENEIKISQLRDLSDELIKELFPLIGHRILLKEKFAEYYTGHMDTNTTLTTKSGTILMAHSDFGDDSLGDLENLSQTST